MDSITEGGEEVDIRAELRLVLKEEEIVHKELLATVNEVCRGSFEAEIALSVVTEVMKKRIDERIRLLVIQYLKSFSQSKLPVG